MPSGRADAVQMGRRGGGGWRFPMLSLGLLVGGRSVLSSSSRNISFPRFGRLSLPSFSMCHRPQVRRPRIVTIWSRPCPTNTSRPTIATIPSHSVFGSRPPHPRPTPHKLAGFPTSQTVQGAKALWSRARNARCSASGIEKSAAWTQNGSGWINWRPHINAGSGVGPDVPQPHPRPVRHVLARACFFDG